MRDHPILFSGAMVSAILREIEQPGTGKTQTRRILKSARVLATPESPAFTLIGKDMERALQNAAKFRRMDSNGWFWESDAFEWQAPHTRTGWLAHIGYAPGDRLWVREAWKTHASYDDLSPSEMGGDEIIRYEADGSYQTWGWANPTKLGRARASIHMPRWASRITLIVEDVRVQRLQEISEEDAQDEGVEVDSDGWRDYLMPATQCCGTAKASFITLWESINGPASWDTNPWVSAYTFRPILANIDQVAP